MNMMAESTRCSQSTGTQQSKQIELSQRGFGRRMSGVPSRCRSSHLHHHARQGEVDPARRNLVSLLAEHFVVGVVLLIGWVILLAATQRSLGFLGLLLGGALLGGVVWMLVDIGWLNVSTFSSATWVGLICISALLAIGLSWSHVWRRLTGQFEVDSDDG